MPGTRFVLEESRSAIQEANGFCPVNAGMSQVLTVCAGDKDLNLEPDKEAHVVHQHAADL